MYAGKSVEYASAANIFNSPKHPYTEGLLKSIPRMDTNVDTLPVIEGTVPNQYNMPPGCRFHTRCAYKTKRCETDIVGDYMSGETKVACFKYA
ncbi:MAG: hypothetical protein FWE00_03775 [Defluviitaleaceae bacterium]|nr:hypothetical protein [Defluviitaleaceae bacterium]